MVNYTERVEELTGFLRQEFGIDDPQMVEILLGSKLETDKIPYPWLVLETNYYSVLTKDAWFALGDGEGPGRPVVLSVYRTSWPRACNVSIEEVLALRHAPRLFVEPEYEKPSHPHWKAYLFGYLQNQCVHLRGRYPKRDLVDKQAFQQLRNLTARILDNRFRTVEPTMPKAPAGLLYWAELLQKLAPNLHDWDTLLRNLYGIAGRRAYLFNREVDPSDWQAVTRCMRDTVPVWTNRIIQQLYFKDGYWNTLKAQYSERTVRTEIERLYGNGVVYRWRSRWRLHDKEETGSDIIHLLNGNIEL